MKVKEIIKVLKQFPPNLSIDEIGLILVERAESISTFYINLS